MSTDNTDLEALRRDIDRIDDAIHDLIIERAALVHRIASQKPLDRVPLRPGREAAVLRRLVERHRGGFPARAVVRIWREIMSALVGMQAPFSIAAYQPSDRCQGLGELARNHFGVVWPLIPVSSPGQVVRRVADGQASVGVVPLPGSPDSGDEANNWWHSLTALSGDVPRVVARLPFAEAEPAKVGPSPPQALVVACRDHDETGDDCTLLVLETAPDVSRDRTRALLAAVGIELTANFSVQRAEFVWLHLVEVKGFLTAADARIADLVAAKDPVTRATVVGGYARPLAHDRLI